MGREVVRYGDSQRALASKDQAFAEGAQTGIDILLEMTAGAVASGAATALMEKYPEKRILGAPLDLSAAIVLTGAGLLDLGGERVSEYLLAAGFGAMCETTSRMTRDVFQKQIHKAAQAEQTAADQAHAKVVDVSPNKEAASVEALLGKVLSKFEIIEGRLDAIEQKRAA